mgnify:CR=1 FL=1
MKLISILAINLVSSILGLSVSAQTEQYGYPVVNDQFINADKFLGWLQLTESPWVYSYNLNSWLLISADAGSTKLNTMHGVWIYVQGISVPSSSGSNLVYGFPVIENYINTGGFLSWLYIQNTPWVYSTAVSNWIWLASPPSTDLKSNPHTWAYFLNKHITSGSSLEVSDIAVANITDTSAAIQFSSNQPATAQLHYGLTDNNLNLASDLIDAQNTLHDITLSNLTANTTYYYQVESTDKNSKSAQSGVLSFKTASPGALGLSNMESTQITSGSALIRSTTNKSAKAQVLYGLSKSALTEIGELIDEGNHTHAIVLDGLEPLTTYYFRITSTDILNPRNTQSSNVMSFVTLGTSDLFMTQELTQYGITWTFEQAHQAGRFANGDWWVVGPVNVTSVTPAPGPAPEDEEIAGNLSWRYGDAGLQDDNQRRNGSMMVMSPGNQQGYDSRGLNYSASTSLSFPYTLPANRSLMSSRSYRTIPNPRLHQAIMWASEKNGYNPIQTVAVLTCLDQVPPTDAFRPAYVGTEKIIYQTKDLRWDRLQNLPLDTSSIPSWEQYERYFQRVWTDHLNGAWQGQHLLANENMASYGRDISRMVGQASLMLHLDVPQDTKEKLLINLIQYGIDLRGLVQQGAHYNQGGGHTSGRKWPILFAGLMLDDEDFLNLPSTALFHEDVQTYYGNGWAGQSALWQMIVHHGIRKTYLEQHPSIWNTYDSGWAKTAESYRTCCTIKAWAGQTLSALLMGAKGLWNHNAYFDNVEDWMRQEDLYAANRDGYARNSQERASFETFVNTMWMLYRDEVPNQSDGDVDLKWIPAGIGLDGNWVNNPKPN